MDKTGALVLIGFLVFMIAVAVIISVVLIFVLPESSSETSSSTSTSSSHASSSEPPQPNCPIPAERVQKPVNFVEIDPATQPYSLILSNDSLRMLAVINDQILLFDVVPQTGIITAILDPGIATERVGYGDFNTGFAVLNKRVIAGGTRSSGSLLSGEYYAAVLDSGATAWVKTPLDSLVSYTLELPLRFLRSGVAVSADGRAVSVAGGGMNVNRQLFFFMDTWKVDVDSGDLTYDALVFVPMTYVQPTDMFSHIVPTSLCFTEDGQTMVVTFCVNRGGTPPMENLSIFVYDKNPLGEWYIRVSSTAVLQNINITNPGFESCITRGPPFNGDYSDHQLFYIGFPSQNVGTGIIRVLDIGSKEDFGMCNFVTDLYAPVSFHNGAMGSSFGVSVGDTCPQWLYTSTLNSPLLYMYPIIARHDGIRFETPYITVIQGNGGTPPISHGQTLGIGVGMDATADNSSVIMVAQSLTQSWGVQFFNNNPI